MSLVTFRWFSKVLEKQVETQLLVPEHHAGVPGHAGRFATFYLLHGLSDDSTMWLRRSRIEDDVAGLPLIVVMPDGFRGFYTDNHRGQAFGKYVGEELVHVIDRVFPTIAEKSARCVGGLSMGGYGALRTALTYPQKFASANSHSGAVAAGRHTEPRPDTAWGQYFDDIFGPASAASRGGPHDLVALATAAHAAGTLPQLLIDCGESDFLFQDNLDVTADLAAAGVPHTFRRFPGAHDWDYWADHVRDAVRVPRRGLGAETNEKVLTRIGPDRPAAFVVVKARPKGPNRFDDSLRTVPPARFGRNQRIAASFLFRAAVSPRPGNRKSKTVDPAAWKSGGRRPGRSAGDSSYAFHVPQSSDGHAPAKPWKIAACSPAAASRPRCGPPLPRSRSACTSPATWARPPATSASATAGTGTGTATIMTA